jgi:hypothetical protein
MKKLLSSLLLIIFLGLNATLSLGFRAVQEVDSVEQIREFVPDEQELLTNFLPLLHRDLVSAKIDPSYKLWADYAWKADKGNIAERYGDSSISDYTTLGRKEDATITRTLRKIVEKMKNEPRARSTWDADDIRNKLSASEKYDLLLGDLDAGTTRAFWANTQQLVDDNDMAPWKGICGGSSGASIYFPEPVNPVTLLSPIKTQKYPDGIPVTFNARDVRGLSSIMFTGFVLADDRRPVLGRPCNAKADEYSCFDTNPATLYIMALNWIGRFGLPIVGDIDPGEAIWNLPIVSYKIKGYFNPNKPSKLYDFDELREATLPKVMVAYSEFKKDKFADKRSSQIAYLVGVNMDVTYAEPNSDRGPNGSQMRSTKTVSYKFDLEMDEAFRILGGEWHEEQRPDFLWVLPGEWGKFYPTSIGDAAIDYTEGELTQVMGSDGQLVGHEVPEHWRETAIRYSSPGAQPLLGVVRHLVLRSMQK